jgi:hypothetical protein
MLSKLAEKHRKMPLEFKNQIKKMRGVAAKNFDQFPLNNRKL